jgi:hypothetical protein
VPGPSRNARPRVADPAAPALERDLADAARALSAGLAARRHAAGLTQAELAELAGVSVTTVGHAETGRTWQSRRFWERADAALRAAGDLLRLHDAYRAASSPQQGQRSTADSIERTLGSTRPVRAPSLAAAPPAGHFPVGAPQAGRAQGDPFQGDPFLGGPSPARPAQVGPPQVGPSCAGASRAFATRAGAAQVSHTQADAADAAEYGITQASPGQLGPSPVGGSQLGASQPGAVQIGPSRIVIVWTDGTVTTVHAPEVSPGHPDVTPPNPDR